jgi:hypothetical protein
MEAIRNYLRRRSLLKLEKKIANEQYFAIKRFIGLPVVEKLYSHYSRVNEIESALAKIHLKKDRLTNSHLFGSQLYAMFYYWPDEKYKKEITERTKLINEINKKVSLPLSFDNLTRLHKYVASYRSKKCLLSKAERVNISETNSDSEVNDRRLIQGAILAGTMGIAFNGLNSAMQSSMVYDALRRVNSNFKDSSDSEIWFDMMLLNLLDQNSHQGMVNLAKGAYFEDLVAVDSKGILHENFNTPDTDMTVDGELIQIKATDSLATINSIDPSISVIATTEVASKSNAIDSGYTNAEVTNRTEGALGGDPFDSSGSFLDGASFFTGSIGLFAIFRGLGSAGEHIDKNKKIPTGENSKDLEEELTLLAESSIVGLETAIVTTINALPTTWNLLVTLSKWSLNAIHILLYPVIKILT